MGAREGYSGQYDSGEYRGRNGGYFTKYVIP